MKCESKQLYRKIKKGIISFCVLSIIIGIGIGFFSILQSILYSYENQAIEYYQNNKLPDMVVDVSDIGDTKYEEIRNIPGISASSRRMVLETEYVNIDSKLRIIVVEDLQSMNILNKYHENNSSEIIDNGGSLLKRNADALSLGIGDEISFKYNNQKFSLSIESLSASPEYVYLAESINVPLANPDKFSVFFVSSEIAEELFDVKYNQITILTKEGVEAADIKDQIDQILGEECRRIIDREDILSYSLYKSDLDQISSFSFVFPFVFFLVSVMVIYVLIKRDITKERKQLGIKKALGISTFKLLSSYLKYTIYAVVFGLIIALSISFFISKPILSLLGEMFEIPSLRADFYLLPWIIGASVALVVCLVSALISVLAILKINPSEAMRDEKPKGGKKILIEHAGFFWKKLSVNTRYSLKGAFRNKARFCAVIIGMSAAAVLAVFSLGFHDSLRYMASEYYDDLIQYDAKVEVSPKLLSEECGIEKLHGITDFEKVLTAPIIIKKPSSDIEKELRVLISERPTEMLNIKMTSGESLTVGNGIVIPEYFSTLMNVEVGDTLLVKTFDSTYKQEFVIDGFTNQQTEFYAILRYDSVTNMFKDNVKVFNALFVKYDDDNVINDLKQLNSVESITTKSDSKNSLSNLLETVDLLVLVLLLFSFTLGVTVLFSVCIVNLIARRYEFSTLKVLGYSRLKILLLSIKESIIQLVIALPIGFLLGNASVFLIKNEFSTDAFFLSVHTNPKSFLYSGILVVFVTICIWFYTFRYLNKLDVVKILKEKE